MGWGAQALGFLWVNEVEGSLCGCGCLYGLLCHSRNTGTTCPPPPPPSSFEEIPYRFPDATILGLVDPDGHVVFNPSGDYKVGIGAGQARGGGGQGKTGFSIGGRGEARAVEEGAGWGRWVQ